MTSIHAKHSRCSSSHLFPHRHHLARPAFLSFASAFVCAPWDVHSVVYPCVTETRTSASSRCCVASEPLARPSQPHPFAFPFPSATAPTSPERVNNNYCSSNITAHCARPSLLIAQRDAPVGTAASLATYRGLVPDHLHQLTQPQAMAE
jgi:hypothetical protein